MMNLCDKFIQSNGKRTLSPGKTALTQNIIKANQDKDIRDYYEIDHQPILGSGISGQVKICTHKVTQMQYALKSLSKRALAREKLNRMKDEIRCMAYLDHPNILRVHEFFENKDVIYLILELCRGGELLDRLHKQQGHHYSEKVACKYVHTMLTAISYCHANNVVHRDLKLENFLFENDSADSELKLIGTIPLLLTPRSPRVVFPLAVVSGMNWHRLPVSFPPATQISD
jgi:calcium-dependent protein kinase